MCLSSKHVLHYIGGLFLPNDELLTSRAVDGASNFATEVLSLYRESCV